MAFSAPNTKEFFPVWKKYKPVIVKLMKDALDNSPQEYQLSKHEFADVNTRKSTTYSFKFSMTEGRPLNSTKTNLMASDLVAVLQQSVTAIELMETAVYSFVLDSQFKLVVGAEKTETEDSEEPEENEETEES